MADTKRYDAFDALRAAMMFLGLVIHSGMSYSSSNDLSWPLRAKDTSPLFLYLVDFIHTFRMPVFFLIAGFFGALLFYNKGPGQMLRNRFQRILLPFIVFLLLLNPFMTYAFKYCRAVFEGQPPLSLAGHFSSIRSYIPFGLYHLWFLYYLFIISCVMYLLSKLARRIPALSFDKASPRVFEQPLYRLLALTAASFLVLFAFGARAFETSISWIPDPGILIYFFAFYTAGWLLFRKKESVSSLTRGDMAMLLLGIGLFFLKTHYAGSMSLTGLQLANSTVTCALALGIIGLFLRVADRPNHYVSYLTRSAYWVYLIHLFIAILLSGLLNEAPIPVYLKFLIVLLGTTALCLVSYHFFVRKKWVDAFLNGKKT